MPSTHNGSLCIVLSLCLPLMSLSKATGEAKVQLALMNNAGIVDAVMTDDSDVFVFGTNTVIQK